MKHKWTCSRPASEFWRKARYPNVLNTIVLHSSTVLILCISTRLFDCDIGIQKREYTKCRIGSSFIAYMVRFDQRTYFTGRVATLHFKNHTQPRVPELHTKILPSPAAMPREFICSA